jgi:hypothetical protein
MNGPLLDRRIYIYPTVNHFGVVCDIKIDVAKDATASRPGGYRCCTRGIGGCFSHIPTSRPSHLHERVV